VNTTPPKTALKTLFLISALFIFSALTVDWPTPLPAVNIPEEPLQDVLQCDDLTDEGWRFRDRRERWLGDDPTLKYRNGLNLIRITHYGLEDSGFRTPAEYVEHLQKIFDELEAVEPTSLAGREGILVRLRYEHREFTGHHGEYVPAEYSYEEFIIVPMDEGFLVFNLTLHHALPMPEGFYKGDEAVTGWEEELFQQVKTWQKFLASCSIVS